MTTPSLGFIIAPETPRIALPGFDVGKMWLTYDNGHTWALAMIRLAARTAQACDTKARSAPEASRCGVAMSTNVKVGDPNRLVSMVAPRICLD